MEQTFGSYVREKRMARGLSLRGLAAQLEVSPVYMSNMENDRRPAPTKKNWTALSRFGDYARRTRNCCWIWPPSLRRSVYRRISRITSCSGISSGPLFGRPRK